MSGKHGAISFLVGSPSEQKPVDSGQCVECGSVSYRQTFVPGRGWFWRCYACDPDKPRIERRMDRNKRPMGYVPSGYDRIARADKINAELKAGNKVARRANGAEVSGFRVKVH